MCHTDIAFRLICAGDVADHTVIARFRQAHEAAFAELFTQVLALCREAGPARLCMVAIDGSKVAADAPEQANRASSGSTPRPRGRTVQPSSTAPSRR
ncbi:MAG: transposase [Pseudonocardia sp.]|nr:transposase [Pseudonocardia sp.]